MKNIKIIFTNAYLKLISVAIASIIWFIVVWSIDPKVTTVVKNVPIEFNTSESIIVKKLGLSVIEGNNLFATIYLQGNRNVVGLIKPEDLLAFVSTVDVTDAGTYELEVKTSVKNQLYNDIKFSAVSPSVVKVKFDRISTKTIPINVICNGAVADEGYILDDPIASVDEVIINGPEKDIEKVDKANVVCDVNRSLNETLNMVEEISLISDNFGVIDRKYINVDHEIINITLPVLKKKKLPIIVDFINEPPNFPINQLKYVVEPKEIEIAGKAEEVDKKESINIAYIDLKKLYLDHKEGDYTIKIPSNFVNIANIEKVKIKFDMDNMADKIFSNVVIKNPYSLSGYNINLNSKYLNNVKIIGKKDIIENLVSGDIVAEIEFNSDNITSGQKNVPLNIYIPNKGLVWAIGDYKAIITISEKN